MASNWRSQLDVPAAGGGGGSGGGGSGGSVGEGRVTAEPTVYVDVTKLSAKDKKELNAPRCCDGGAAYCSMFCLCCLCTVIAPLLLIFAIRPAVPSLEQALFATAITLAALGLFYFCCISSFRDLVVGAVFCPSKGVEQVPSWADIEAPRSASAIKKLKVIVNPNAGVRRGASNLDICKKIWEELSIEVIVVNTTHAGHAREIGRTENLDGIDALCAIGGDGTIHELVNGFMSRDVPSDVPLGFIPGGSGNSIMAHFGTWDVAEAACRIAAGEVNHMDIMEICTCGETIVSPHLVGFGLVGASGILAEDYRCLGPARYNIVALWKIMTGMSEKTKVVLTDSNDESFKAEDTLVMSYLNKTQHFGKGLRAAPYAKMGNGLMEFYGIKAKGMSRGNMVAFLLQLPEARHQETPAVTYHQCTDAKLTFPEPGLMTVDGEVVRHDGTVHLKCLKGRLKILTPRDTIALKK
mmetsp:Transcript_30315/g.59466  ORF Transcript_30315/g.59466 Transcript_30315/m.59466 type:complete len:466 (+) Transcript_30315:35-1432(+)